MSINKELQALADDAVKHLHLILPEDLQAVIDKIPADMVLVPREPTGAMLDAMDEYNYYEGGYGADMQSAYKAMLKAAKE